MCAEKKCNKCGLCCQGSMGPFIFPSDLESISNFLGIEKQQFLKSYCECNNIPNNAGLIIYSLKMKDRIEQLLSDIDEDKTVQPFITFARLFQNKVIEEVMIALYEMINSGNKDIYLNQFVKVFEDFKTRNKQEAEEKRYRKFDTLNMLSVVGSGYIMIVLSLTIISLLGEATNGF